MTGDFWIARTPVELRERVQHFVDYCDGLPADRWPICWKAEKYQHPRSLDQNSLIHALYADIASQMDGEGVVDIRRRCKLHYGVPILRAHDEEFRSVYDKIVRPHDYDDKLKIMDFLPVTSRMKKTQATEFIDTVQREYSEQGVRFSA